MNDNELADWLCDSYGSDHMKVHAAAVRIRELSATLADTELAVQEKDRMFHREWAENERLRATMAKANALHHEADPDDVKWSGTCRGCGQWWPCDTHKALGEDR